MKILHLRKTQATYTIIILNLILFGLEIHWGGSNNLYTLDSLGALVPEKVWSAGEWWRLLSANFLHFGVLHLFTNMLALFLLGRIVELNLGTGRYLLVYFSSGIGSMLFFSLLSLKRGETNLVLVGASAAIMGLIGVLLAISLRVWLKKKTALNAKRLKLIILVIIIQFIFDYLVPQVSFYSHLFGLIIGFLVGSFLLLINFNYD
jgi:rhomboid protease GluP